MMQGTKHKAQIGLSDNDARYKALDIWCKQLHICKDPNREEEEEIGLSDNNERYKARHKTYDANNFMFAKIQIGKKKQKK